MSEPTPAEKVVAILKRELPGFESRIHAGTDTIQVRGTIRFGASVVLDPIYAVPEHEVEAFAAHLVERTRREVIELVGLEALIRHELQRARHEASIAAFADGKKAGIAEGRREMLAEVLAVREGGEWPGDE